MRLHCYNQFIFITTDATMHLWQVNTGYILLIYILTWLVRLLAIPPAAAWSLDPTIATRKCTFCQAGIPWTLFLMFQFSLILWIVSTCKSASPYAINLSLQLGTSPWTKFVPHQKCRSMRDLKLFLPILTLC